MNNLDSKKELKKILRSQSTPKKSENILTFGKKENNKVNKIEENTKTQNTFFDFKKKKKEKSKFVQKKRFTSDFKNKIQNQNIKKKTTHIHRKNNELKFQKIFSVYNKKNKKKEKKKVNKTIKKSSKKLQRQTPKTKETIQRASLKNKKQDTSEETPYFSNRNIFGFNNYSETGYSSEDKSNVSYSNSNIQWKENNTINLGKIHWKESSSGSNDKKGISQIVADRHSKISETGSSMFIPKTKILKSQNDSKRKNKIKNNTEGSRLFKTNIESRRVNLSASKSMRFLKNFKAGLSKNKT
jgi:hypothetical protein